MLKDYVKAGVLKTTNPDFIHPGDMEKIAVPTDFLGLNYYTRNIVNTKDHIGNFPDNVHPTPQADEKHTEMGWEVYADGLLNALARLYSEYQPKALYVTENGASYSDGPDAQGRIHDPERIRYLRTHFTACHRAIQMGVPLHGFFVWSW